MRGALDAGANFFAGYPISPASEIGELCSLLLPERGGVFVQMEDEIGSLAAVIGASLAGAKAFTATSGPGFSLMQENLGFAVMAEVPCVIINVQRVGPATGIATRPAQSDVYQARWGSHGDYSLIVLAPSSIPECYLLTIEAFNLAERFRTPVILLTDAALAHLREKIPSFFFGKLPGKKRKKPQGPPQDYLCYRPEADLIPPLAAYGDPYILRVTGLVHNEKGYSTDNPEETKALLTRLREKIENYPEELPAPLYFGPEEIEVLLVAYGTTLRAARAAARRTPFPAGVLGLTTLWPFPDQAVKDFCHRAKLVVVPEMNAGQAGREVMRVCREKPVLSFTRTDGEVITPAEILSFLERNL